MALDYQQDGWSIQPRLFWYDIEDYITKRASQSQPANIIAMMMGAMPPLQWSNVDTEIYGGDIAIGYGLAPRSLEIHTSYQTSKWHAYVQWMLVDSQEDVSSIQNESTSRGYGVVDLGGDYRFSEALSVNLAIHNIV